MCTRRSLRIVLLAGLLGACPLFAQTPIDYSYVDIEYGIDSTIEMFGGSFDSDDGLAITGSWQFAERWYALTRYATNGYDLTGRDGLGLEFVTAGVGYRHPIRQDQTPIDFIVQVNYEHQRTDIETTLARETLSDSGTGLRFGVRALITPHFEVGAFTYHIGYPYHGDGNIDGLHFELTSTLSLTDRLGVTFTYLTGEIDYPFLPGFAAPVEVEVDRNDMRLGLRYRF